MAIRSANIGSLQYLYQADSSAADSKPQCHDLDKEQFQPRDIEEAV